jgi:hypothetical protein
MACGSPTARQPWRTSPTTIPCVSARGPTARRPHDAAMALADGADLLIHDAQHTGNDFPAKAYLGHSTVEYLVALAVEAKAKRLLLYHHDPYRTDDECLTTTGSIRSRAAEEGPSLDRPTIPIAQPAKPAPPPPNAGHGWGRGRTRPAQALPGRHPERASATKRQAGASTSPCSP